MVSLWRPHAAEPLKNLSEMQLLSLSARVTHETTLANIIKFAVINDKVTSRRHLNYLFSAPFDPQGKGVYFIKRLLHEQVRRPQMVILLSSFGLQS